MALRRRVPAGQVPLWISVLDSYSAGAATELSAELPAAPAARVAGPGRADLAFELGVRPIVEGVRRVPAQRDS